MLGVREVEVGENQVGHEAFKDLGGWAEEGDGSVGRSLFFWFFRLEEGHDDDVFSFVGDSGVGIGEVKNPAQVAQAQGAKVLQLEH